MTHSPCGIKGAHHGRDYLFDVLLNIQDHARVLLQNTPILILDEPTAALDNESEFYIREAMKEICKNRTVIVIAHRLSTIRRADKIVVLDSGRIAEEGKHEALMKRKGVYAMLQERAARI